MLRVMDNEIRIHECFKSQSWKKIEFASEFSYLFKSSIQQIISIAKV